MGKVPWLVALELTAAKRLGDTGKYRIDTLKFFVFSAKFLPAHASTRQRKFLTFCVPSPPPPPRHHHRSPLHCNHRSSTATGLALRCIIEHAPDRDSPQVSLPFLPATDKHHMMISIQSILFLVPLILLLASRWRMH